MSEIHTFYTEQFTIRANEVDTSGNLTLKAICDFFQEVAGNNAKELNFDITDLQGQDLTWVLHRMDIQIKKYPKWRETITIETWPAAGDALRAYRNYRILDENGTELGCCLSYWMMINMKTRRPVRMPKEVLDTRLSKREHVLPVKSNKINPFEEPEMEQNFVVRKSDLDMNEHVNNARFIEWLMECYDEKKKYLIKNVDIVFRKESKAGDTVTSQRLEHEPKKFTHQLKNQEGEILALARCS